ncbi:MAG: addiction module antidote protein, HigA family, partial [Cyanobacteria bacterium QH_1_48_107]
VKIARYLGTTPNIWLDLQTDYLVAIAEKKLDAAG